MLRHGISRSARQLVFVHSRRSYATKGGKRALNKQQLQGKKPGAPPPAAAAKDPTPPPPTPPPPSAAATPTGGDGGGGSNTPLIMGGLALVAAGGAAYYYQNMTDEETPATTPADEVKKEEPTETAAADEVKKEESTETVAEEVKAEVPAETEQAKEEEEKPVTSIQTEDGSNHVLQTEITEETQSDPPSEPVESPHPEEGNKVTMESSQEVSKKTTVSVKDSLKELQASIDQEASEVTKRANQEVMRSFDESIFEGLDDMTTSQLRARVMMLATEMKERTKWEALRLKEFLALKEKETADKYLDVLQQQRLEFEAILQRRLMEQEHEMTTQSNAKLQEKDGAVKEMIDTAIQRLGEEHENEKKAMMEKADQEIKTHYEKMFSDNLEKFKQGAIDELERKVQSIEALNKKLADLEGALASSQNYHEGSLQAHRLSAAALALAEKMESNKGAAAELNALKACAGKDNVIAAALSSVPSSIAKGVPTLPELQARFESVLRKTRQAALVPSGLAGLEGQLAGMMFATLKYPPKPEDPPPEDNTGAAEYILVRARQHVQFGELEKAVEQLDKLDGQAAFTVQGWKKDATDRVAVESALKVIKLECALLNESMSKTP